MVEAIARRFITGSMWRAYERGAREFCGIQLPDDLHPNQKLNETLVTPSTKGIMRGLDGIPEADDTNVSREQLLKYWREFGFRAPGDVDRYETLLKEGAELIASHLSPLELMLVDTKFEFGYAKDSAGEEHLIYMDEVGTPDSSRIWDAVAYRGGRIVENSKEEFRQALLRHVKDPSCYSTMRASRSGSSLLRTTRCRPVCCTHCQKPIAQWPSALPGSRWLCLRTLARV